MALRNLKPNTPATRFYSIPTFEEITKTTPEKSLLSPKRRSGGRNNLGRMTARHRGGGHKRMYRIVDFKRDKIGIDAKVASIEYDPNRSARIALLHYVDGEKRYILAPDGVKVGEVLSTGADIEIKAGNTMPLRNVPPGLFVHNVEITPKKGGQIARGAGTYAQVAAREADFVLLKLPSGEVRKFRGECMATIGIVGNLDHENISLGKAGRSRWLGIRPSSRAMAKNPVDHPMGGGEGRSKSGGGRQHPVSPWGQPAKGYKTRKRNKDSSKYIVTRRKK